MSVYAVVYTYSADSAGREEHRPAHKRFLDKLGEQGGNICSGPFGPEETPGALLLLRAESREHALALTDGDPFRVHGLVADVRAQEWIPMLGHLAGQM